jgi:hypothetical protein
LLSPGMPIEGQVNRHDFWLFRKILRIAPERGFGR